MAVIQILSTAMGLFLYFKKIAG